MDPGVGPCIAGAAAPGIVIGSAGTIVGAMVPCTGAGIGDAAIAPDGVLGIGPGTPLCIGGGLGTGAALITCGTEGAGATAVSPEYGASSIGTADGGEATECEAPDCEAACVRGGGGVRGLFTDCLRDGDTRAPRRALVRCR